MNEKRVFSDKRVLAKIAELNVLLLRADITDDTTEETQAIKRDLARANRSTIPVNLVYPADPDEPAILLEEIVTPEDALEALERVARS